MLPMTDTQYRVLGDLVAGATLTGKRAARNAPWRWRCIPRSGPSYGVAPATLRALATAGLITRPDPMPLWFSYAVPTDAGRAAYAQAQARRAAQAPTG
jgi:hypothetical protein